MKKKPKKKKKLEKKPNIVKKQPTTNFFGIDVSSQEHSIMSQMTETQAMDYLLQLSQKHSDLKNIMISTQCPNCNLKLIIPEIESHRCILCGCKELSRQEWSQT